MPALPENLQLVPLTAERLPDVLELDRWAFPAPETLEELLGVPSPLPWERTFGVIDPDEPGRLLAMHASYPFAHCPVPGAQLPVAGLTWVGVHPEQRRRGILRAMIATHFEHCRAWAEPVSMLFAAEPAIYGRFGYGLAARQVRLTLPRRAALRPVPGTEEVRVRIDNRTAERHTALISDLHAGSRRPGWVTRETPELVAAWMDDSPLFRDGHETARIAIAERAGRPVGYALFRRKGEWNDGVATGTVRVTEVVAPDAAVAHALWKRLLDLDLTTEVTTGPLPVDDPLLSLLVDLRATRPRLQDNVWARLIDLPAALAGRRYAADLDVVLEVADADLAANAGRWRLTAPAFGPAEVRRTTAEPDLGLDVRELGAAYLGGVSLHELAAAGLVRATDDGRLARASIAFGWPHAPGSSWVF